MIQPPAKRSLFDLQLWLLDQVTLHYELFEDGSRCKGCGTTDTTQTIFVSIHASEWGDECAGPGRVKRITVPRCPVCEPDAPDSLYTCVHMPYAELHRELDELV